MDMVGTGGNGRTGIKEKPAVDGAPPPFLSQLVTTHTSIPYA
jgi:hypothetical protein